MRKTGAYLVVLGLTLAGFCLLHRAEVRAGGLLPDLAIKFHSTTLPGQFVITQDISSSVRPMITNLGQASVSSFWAMAVLSQSPNISINPDIHSPVSGGRLLGKKVFSKPLAPGASQILDFGPMRLPDDISYGSYYISVIADPGNLIPESKETNNMAQASIWVLAMTDLVEEDCESDGRLLVLFTGKGFGTWKSTMAVHVGPYTFPVKSQDWSNTQVYGYCPPELVPVGTQFYDVCLYDGLQAISPTSHECWQIQLYADYPNSGPPGTTVHLKGCNCQTQGTKKVSLWQIHAVSDVPVISWTMGEIVCTIPNVPAGKYCFSITDGGQLIQSGYTIYFEVK